MDSVNNSSDIQSRASAFANGALSSLSTGFDYSDHGPFAELLTQTQVAPLPELPPVPPVTPSNSSVNQPATAPNNQQPSQTQQTSQSQQSNSANSAPDASNSTSSSNTNDTGTSVSSQTPAQQTSSSSSHVGKSSRHNAKHGTKNDQSDKSVTSNPAPSALAPTATVDASQTTPTGNAPTALDANGLPIDDTSSNTNTDADLAAGDTTATPAASPDPAINTAAQDASALNAIPATDIQTPSTAPTVSAGNNDNTDKNGNAPATDSGASSGLMSLLMQLEHLAASQLANTPSATNSDAPAATGSGQTQNTNVASSTTPSANNPQDKIDLKALLTAVAKLDNETLSNGDGNSPIDTSATNNSQSSSPATPTTTTASQGVSSAANATSPAVDNNKWISPAFLNLFNVSPSDPSNAGTPLILTPIVGTTAGNDGTTLGADTQSEGDTNTRDAAANLSGSNNSSLSSAAMGTTQAASPYDFAAQLSATRATQGGSTGLPSPLDQVVLQLSRGGLSKDGSTQMTIQLRPAELGRVDVKLNISSDGKVQGTVTADNPATLGLLLKDVRGLERALQEAGLRADSGSLQFGLRGDGQPGGGSGQTANNQSGSTDDSGFSNSSITLPGFIDAAETYYLTPGGVNMRV